MKFLNRIFYQIWYFGIPPWDTNQTPPEVYVFIDNHPPGRALDLGCGTGTNAITLAQHGWQVTGVDFIPKAIRTARRKARKAGVNIKFLLGDVTRLKGINHSFEFILDIGCYHSLDQSGMANYRKRIDQLLAPGGTYLIYLFFSSDDNLSGSQAKETDVEAFSEFLTLIQRQDGLERGTRPSAWLTFRKQKA